MPTRTTADDQKKKIVVSEERSDSTGEGERCLLGCRSSGAEETSEISDDVLDASLDGARTAEEIVVLEGCWDS